MGLFKPKQNTDEIRVRCPDCGEYVPDGVGVCTMCGRDLTDVLDSQTTNDAGHASGARDA